MGAQSKEFPSNHSYPHNYYRWSMLAWLSPYLEQSNVYKSLDLNTPLFTPPTFDVAPANRLAAALIVPLFLCPSDQGKSVSSGYGVGTLGPTNYAGTAGTGIRGGTPFDPDGSFYINSAKRFRDFTDGTSNTVVMSESTLGTGAESTIDPSYVAKSPDTVYGFILGSPLTDSACANVTQWNVTNRRGFMWVDGEYRCTLYNHYYTPNSPTPDCLGVSLDSDPAKSLTGYGWRAARSKHPTGVNALLADGSVQFVSELIELTVWRGLATLSGGENTIGEF